VARFEALQRCLVPRSRRFTDAQREASRDLINGVLADKPAAVHFKIALFLFLIDGVALIFGLRRFAGLGSARQRRVMDFFFDSKIALLRKGFWGVNTLAKLGVYGQPSVYGEIGYVKRAVAA
jgi:hypothetical protein